MSVLENIKLVKDLENILNVKWELNKVYDPQLTKFNPKTGKWEKVVVSESWWSIPDDVRDHLMQKLLIYIKDRDFEIIQMATKRGIKK